MRSSATVVTPNAQRYMVELCRHFGHKVPSEWSDHEGRIRFEMGRAALRAAPETLMLVADAPDTENLSRLEQVVDSHLKRFAAGEPGMAVDWRRGA